MAYDPFARGRHPVGVRTVTLADSARSGRQLPTELWFPADGRHAGRDLSRKTCDRYEALAGMGAAWQSAVRDAEPAPGRFPLALFSHGFGSERRQSSFLCTHLASHGYVVASPDHVGNTISDVMAAVMASLAAGQPPRLFESIGELLGDRPRDMVLVADRISRAFDWAERMIDTDLIGIAGHSFGGWTALTTTARDRRIAAVLPLAPAGGSSAVIGRALSDQIELDWGREVPTVIIAAERDSLLPMVGMNNLFGRVSEPKRMFVLLNADHMHFCDRPKQVHEMFRSIPRLSSIMHVQGAVPPFAELCPAEHSLLAIRGVGLAHFDAVIKGLPQATAFLRDQAVSDLSRRGVDVDTH